MPGNYRSSMSSHSDIFMKADEQKINFGKRTSDRGGVWTLFLGIAFGSIVSDLSDMGCMSPLYATPPMSPGSDTNVPNFDEPFVTPTAIFTTAHAIEHNDHFARDTHMRIILGNSKENSNAQK